MAAMRTTLHLLTRDGAVFMAFEPELTPTQYARLIDIANRAATAQELKDAVTAWARAERLRAAFDESVSPTGGNGGAS